MFTSPRGPAWSFIDAFESLVRVHPAAFFGSSRSREAEREIQDRLAHLPAHLRDDLGLPPLPPEEPEHPALTRARRRAARWG